MIIEQPTLGTGKFLSSFISSNKAEEVRDLLKKYFKREVILLNSGRTAIYLALKAKSITRTDEIVVPEFTSQCVLNAINRTAFPNTRITGDTRAFLLLHQFGYPQKVDQMNLKKFFVIEDCAHSIASEYNGVKVGNLFDTAILSFPKIFSTIQGGAIVTKDREIIDYANEVLHKEEFFPNLLQTYLFSMFLFEGQKNNYKRQRIINAIYSQLLDVPHIPKYVCRLFPTPEEMKSHSKRREHILRTLIRELGKEHFPETKDKIVPFYIPYLDSVENLEKIQKTLASKGIELPILHFDVNRNMLDSDYRKSLIIPAHQTISDEVFKEIIRWIT